MIKKNKNWAATIKAIHNMHNNNNEIQTHSQFTGLSSVSFSNSLIEKVWNMEAHTVSNDHSGRIAS